MNRKLVKTAMMCGAAWAAPTAGVIVFPSAAQAETICTSLLGTDIQCVEGSTVTATGTINPVSVVVTGPGLVATSPDDLIGTLTGDITTTSPLTPAITLTAADELVFDFVGTATTTGDGSTGVILTALGDIDAAFDTVITTGDGSDGLVATTIGDLTIVTDTIATFGDDSDGLVLSAENITAICGTVTTAGDNSIGIDATASGTLDLTCATVATTGEASDGVVLSGTDITADLGTVTTDGIGSDAVVATATGDLDITSDTIITLQDDSDGLVLTAENITAVCGTVSTSGDNSIGIDATASGSIDLRCASVGTEGNISPGVDLTAPGPISVVIGPVNTGGDDSPGIIIDGGTEPVNLTCGAVVTTGDNSPGVDIDAEGAITVNCESVLTDGDNSDGIQIDGGTGPVSVTVGPVTTDGIDSDGIDVITETGDIDIVAGPVTVTGPDSDGISAVATGCADINITATSDILSADGTAILASTLCAVTVTTLPGASVTGADAGIDVTSGTGATITLNDSVRATAGPAIDVDGAAALINVNAGGSIIGRIDLTDNNDTLNNRGLFDVIGTSDFGGGTDVINNLAGGTVRSVNGNGVLANCETFNNSGTITMIDGAANDTLTVCNNYVGLAGANLGIDVGGTGGGLTADRLIVPGNASGTTGVNLNLIAGSAVVDPDGVLIVDAGTATANPFNLIGPTSAGLINYALRQTGADTFLVSTPDEAIFDIATMSLMGQEMWHQSSGAHQSCAASRRNDFGFTREQPFGVCAQLYGSEDRTGDNDRSATVFDTDLTFSDRLKTKRRGAQVELAFHGANFDAGVTLGYAHSKADARSGTHFHAEGYNYGAFAQFGMASGLYAGAMIKRDDYEARISNGAIIPRTEFDGKSTGIDGEVGWRTPSFGALLDVNAGLSYVKSKMDDFTTGNIAFDNDSETSLRGRIGARLGWSGSYNPYVDAKLFHEFNGDSDVEVRSGSLVDRIEGRGRGPWGRLEAGLGAGAGGGPLFSAWVDLGDVKGWGLRGGFRF